MNGNGIEGPAKLPNATLTTLREAYSLAPPPFLSMDQWTPEAKSAAAEFYHLAHEAFPQLIARAAAGDEVRAELRLLLARVNSRGTGATTEELISLLSRLGV